jgi:hypothetical protein
MYTSDATVATAPPAPPAKENDIVSDSLSY